MSCTRAERGKPNRSHRNVESRPQGCDRGRVGMGGRKKRMPIGNRPDRGSNFALSRKGADFRRVLDHEKGTERLNERGYLDDGCRKAPLKARSALCVSSVRIRIVKVTACVTGCFAAPYQGLSPVRGNLHAGFLGEGRTVRFVPYPTGAQRRLVSEQKNETAGGSARHLRSAAPAR